MKKLLCSVFLSCALFLPFPLVSSPSHYILTCLNCDSTLLVHSSKLLGEFLGACVEAGATIYDYDYHLKGDDVSVFAVLRDGHAHMHVDFENKKCLVSVFSKNGDHDLEVFKDFLCRCVGCSTHRSLCIQCGDHFSIK